MKKLNALFKSVAFDVLPNHSYLFERWSNAAEKVHFQALPAVIHVVPKAMKVELNKFQTQIKPTTTCLVAFFDLCPSLDASGEEVAEVVDRCREDAKRFLAELVRRDGVEVVGDVLFEIAEARHAACLAGVVMQFDVATYQEALCNTLR